MMEPASSSDSDSSPYESDSSSDGPPGSSSKAPKKFDDLPSDDSVGVSSDSDGSDSGSLSSSDSEDDNADTNDMNLGMRLDAKRSGDVVGVSSRKRRQGGKEKALSIAAERLAKYKKERAEKKRQHYDSDSDSDSDSDNGAPETKGTQKKRKKSKHAPTEASSRRSDFYRRGAPDLNGSGIGVAVGANRYKARDPRLEGMSGHFDQDVFDRRYAFLEEMKEGEIEQLGKRIAARKATGKKGQKMRRKLGLTNDGGSLEEDQAELSRLKRERAERERAQVKRKAKQTVKKRIRDEVADGKRGAYHLKRSELKRLELEASFEELRKKGGNAAVEKELAKKRKKRAQRDKRMLPPKSSSKNY